MSIENENGNFAKPVLGAVPSVVYNEDCVEGLKRFSDNHFDLAIVDTPYGIDWMQQIQNPNPKANWKQYENKEWDKQTPTDEYWEQLFRVSKNQIVYILFVCFHPHTLLFLFFLVKLSHILNLIILFHLDKPPLFELV